MKNLHVLHALLLAMVFAVRFDHVAAGKGKGQGSSDSDDGVLLDCKCCRYDYGYDDDNLYAYCKEKCNGSCRFGRGCFSEKATVQVLQKGVISIRDLEVGDKVLTANPQDRYEEVYGFGHYSESKEMTFVKIFTANPETTAPLEITGNHLVYVDGKTHPVRADSIHVGDMLRAEHDISVPVTKIKTVTKNGVYAPLTPSGTVVVDGIVASSYISLQPDSVEYAEFTNGHRMTWLTQQQGCHMWMSPLRLLCMGVSTRFCENYDEDGQLFWVHFGQDLVLWGMQYNLLIEVILLGATLLITTLFYSMELVFGARYAIPMVCVLVGAWLFSRGFGVVFVARKKDSKSKVALFQRESQICWKCLHFTGAHVFAAFTSST